MTMQKKTLWQKIKNLFNSKKNPEPQNSHQDKHTSASKKLNSTPNIKINPKKIDPDTMPISHKVQQYLDKHHFNYKYAPATDNEDIHSFIMLISRQEDDDEWICTIIIQEKNQLISVYGTYPQFIPKSHLATALLFINRLNYNMIIGSLEMDVRDGETRYKNSLDVEATGLNNDILDYLIQSVASIMRVTAPLITQMLDEPPDNKAIERLLEDTDMDEPDNSFIVPTDTIQ